MNRYNLIKSSGRLGVAAMVFAGTFTSLAQVTQTLHETIATSLRNDYTGTVGCVFQTGSSNVVLSHLGIYNASGTGLAVNHNAGIFTSDGSVLLSSVAAAANTAYYYANGYQWIPLDPPMLLTSNTTYLIASDVINGDGDSWNDATAYSSWNPYFVGTTPGSTRNPRYSAGGAAWPTPPTAGWSADNTSYGNVSVAYIEVDKARVSVTSTNVSVAVGQPLNIVGFASGAPTISYQWFKGGGPLSGKTNSTLSIPSAALSDAGIYYLTATNSLGGEQSVSVTVSVTAFPVGISQQPTNFTAIANYTPATFSVTVTGTPPIYLQWSRNGVAIPGANSASYTFIPTSANNGDMFNCLASNYISGTPYTMVSSNVMLNVIANLALPQQFLHGAVTNISQNGYVGCVGGSFVTGTNPTVVTHLGYYAANYTDATHASLIDNHTVYIFNNDYTINASVVVTNGSSLPVINGYIWAPLNPPVTLAPNTTYVLGADTSANDPWGDSYVVSDWSSYYTVPANKNQNQAKYNGTGACPYYGGYSGQIYSAPNMAILSSGAADVISLAPTNVTQYVGLNVSMSAVLNGAPPVTAQWYKAPGTMLTGQTNLSLILSNVQLTDSGNYYIVANNMLGSAQSSNVVVNIVADVVPGIATNLQSQTVFQYATVQYSVGVTGTPPMSYRWTFNGSPIAGANSSVLTLYGASAANEGNYQVIVTNAYGAATSSIAGLSVTVPAWGTYSSAVMGSNLVAYYPLNDATTGTATNQGSLGVNYNGIYEGGYSSVTGPAGYSNFPSNNLAVALDGFSADVLVPSLGITVTNCTIAAWVMDAGGQVDNSTIFCQRQSSTFGIGIGQNGSGEWLKYTWNGGSYNNYTGLILPTNQWAFVAMVINPTNAMIYLQNGTGMSSTNFAGSYSPQTFAGASYIGWDTAGGSTGRRWTGTIGPVMVFNQALSPVAINALYLGVPASATLSIAPAAGNKLVVTWPGGVLLEATNVMGPWVPTVGATNGAYTAPPSGACKFYKVQLQ